VHAAAAAALVTLTWSPPGGDGPADSPPIPIRIRLAPAAGGGAGGAADRSGEPGAPGARGADESAPSDELVIDAPEPEGPLAPTESAPEIAPPPEPVAQAPLEPPAPEEARWLLEVQADPHDVASTPALAAPESVTPDASAPVALAGEWQGAPAAPRPLGVRPPGLGLLDEGAGFGPGGSALAGLGLSDASAGRGTGEGGGHGDGVGPGPGGREGGTGLLPVALGDNIAPEYPIDSRRAGEEGLVVIHAQVSAEGTVTAAEVAESCGYERLDAAALEAVLHWRFQPALHDGQPVAQPVDVPIRFRLRSR